MQKAPKVLIFLFSWDEFIKTLRSMPEHFCHLLLWLESVWLHCTPAYKKQANKSNLGKPTLCKLVTKAWIECYKNNHCHIDSFTNFKFRKKFFTIFFYDFFFQLENLENKACFEPIRFSFLFQLLNWDKFVEKLGKQIGENIW